MACTVGQDTRKRQKAAVLLPRTFDLPKIESLCEPQKFRVFCHYCWPERAAVPPPDKTEYPTGCPRTKRKCGSIRRIITRREPTTQAHPARLTTWTSRRSNR